VPDFGAPQDECTDPNGPKDQGIFLVQKDEYLRGKFLRFTPEAILKKDKLVKGEDECMRLWGAGRGGVGY